MKSTLRRIVVIGNTEVGKTTFLISAYRGLQLAPHGLTVRALQDDDHKTLVLLGQRVAADQFPTGTARHKSYSFSLCYQNNAIITFAWSDYSGRMIFESSDNAQAQALHAELAGADGALVFFDSESLAHNRLGYRELARLFTLLSVAAQDHRRSFSLVFVLTKADLVAHYTAPMLRQLANSLDTISGSRHLRCTLIPVVCGSTMLNVTTPLLFVLTAPVERLVAEHEATATKEEESAIRWQSKATGIEGALDWVYSRLNNISTNGEMATSARRRARVARTAQQRALQALTALRLATANAPLVVDGGSLYDYADGLNRIGKLRTNRI